MNAHRVAAWASAAAVTAAVVAGLAYIGSPAEQRQLRLDERRVLDLKFLAASVNNYWNQQHALPARSSDLVDGRMTTRLSLDPESKQPYDYRVTEANHYELCATFRRRARVDSNDFWFHEAGRRCFSFDAGRSPY